MWLPMPIDGYVRLLVDRWPRRARRRPGSGRARRLAVTRLGLDGRRASGVRWTSSFVMHRRAVTRMRDGRVLLAWLAASVNSPRSRRVASARDALAPAGVVASRRFVTGWLAGAADR